MVTKKLFKGFKKAEEPAPQPRKVEEPVHQSAHNDESNWLVSYADMMTLLCGFFIMLFSMAKLDEPQYENVKEAIAKQFGGEYRSSSEELAHFIKQVVQEIGVEKEATVKYDQAGVSVTFESTVFFDTLKAEIKPEGRKILDEFARKISDKEKTEKIQHRIVAEGHTDSRSIRGGNFPTNWELSGARAASVIRLFLEKGFVSQNLIAIGYADTHPQATDRNAAGEWDETGLAKNRRVVLRILDPKSQAIPFPAAPGSEQATQTEVTPASTAASAPAAAQAPLTAHAPGIPQAPVAAQSGAWTQVAPVAPHPAPGQVSAPAAPTISAAPPARIPAAQPPTAPHLTPTAPQLAPAAPQRAPTAPQAPLPVVTIRPATSAH